MTNSDISKYLIMQGKFSTKNALVFYMFSFSQLLLSQIATMFHNQNLGPLDFEIKRACCLSFLCSYWGIIGKPNNFVMETFLSMVF